MFLKLIACADGETAARALLSMSRIDSEELKLIGEIRAFESGSDDRQSFKGVPEVDSSEANADTPTYQLFDPKGQKYFRLR